MTLFGEKQKMVAEAVLCVGDELRVHHDRRASFLFDPSGGHGNFQPSAWIDRVAGYSCGYVGGLNSETLSAGLERVEDLHAARDNLHPPWVGTESGAQESGLFSCCRAAEFSRSVQPELRWRVTESPSEDNSVYGICGGPTLTSRSPTSSHGSACATAGSPSS